MVDHLDLDFSVILLQYLACSLQWMCSVVSNSLLSVQLARFVMLCFLYFQETIKKQVASMYLWPKTLEVPIMDPSK